MNPEDRQQMERAQAADDAGHPEVAEALLREIVKRNPASFDAVEGLGFVYAEMGKYSKAFPFLERAARLSPSSAPAFANLGAVLLKLNKSDDAVKALRKAAELDRGNAQTQISLGVALMQTNQPALAADAFARAAQLNPRDSDVLYNWSVALLSAGQAAKASEVAVRVPKADSSAQVQSLLGDIAERQDHFKEAVQHYQAAADLDPSEANIYTLGTEFVRHWTFEPAIKIFDYGLSRYPGSVRLLSAKGIARYANNNYAEAAQIFSGLLEKDPDNSLYAEILGHSCNLMPDSIQGCSTLVDFALKHPGNATADVYAAANILHRPTNANTLAQAQTLLDRAIAVNPQQADAYFQLGVLEQQENKWEESAAALEKCVALKPRLSKAHYRLALAYSHTGRKDKAREQLELHRQYSQEEKDQVNARLEAVTTFLVSMK